MGSKTRRIRKRKARLSLELQHELKKRDKTVVSEENDDLGSQPSTSTCHPDSLNDSELTSPCTGASRMKLGDRDFENSDENEDSDENDDDCEFNCLGYRLVDMSVLSSTLSDIHKCEEGIETIFVLLVKRGLACE